MLHHVFGGPPPKKERRNGAAKEQHRAVDPSESIVENCADARSLGTRRRFLHRKTLRLYFLDFNLDSL